MADPSSFVIDPNVWRPRRDLHGDFSNLVEYVNVVDHGEFQKAVDSILFHASRSDDNPCHPKSLALQRCRRGGKTFMLHAIGKRLSHSQVVIGNEIKIFFITFNRDSKLSCEESPLQAILARIAHECSGAREKKEPFRRFRTQYKDFNSVENWILSQKVILLIDELNVIPPSTPGYDAMSEFLDSLVGRKGSALVYSTHLRDTSDLLRNREKIDGSLSKRKHAWLPIPRLVNENCLHGLERQATAQPSFWSAVLRGRLPALMLQDQEDIVDYGQSVSHIFPEGTSVEERAQVLASVITGKIDTLPSSCGLFRAYSYMSE